MAEPRRSIGAIALRVPRRRRARAAAGFTLLEVLAAVAILGIWYAIIAGSAMQGLRSEGQSQRLLEAGLKADSALAELESQLAEGSVPENTDEQIEEGPFLIEKKVGPFSLAGLAALAAGGPTPAPNPGSGLDDDGTGTGPAAGLKELIATEAPDLSANLRTLSVTVTWQEAGRERKTTRTTYAFDMETASEGLEGPGLGGPGAPGAGLPGGLPPNLGSAPR